MKNREKRKPYSKVGRNGFSNSSRNNRNCEKERENILIQTPVYYPFAATTSGNNRVD